MMNKTLVIDCQVFQTMAWHRGMGKYSYELIKGMAGSSKYEYSKTILLFSKNEELANDAKDAINDAFKNINHEIVYLDLNDASTLKSIQKAESHNRKILNTYIKDIKTAPIDYLILCLFIDNSPTFPDNVRKCLLFYDSIPFIFSDKYKDRINFENYLYQYKTVFEADKIFTISQTVADDLAVYFGISADSLINIDGAYIKNGEESSSRPKAIPEGIKYILAPTGDELRKNNLRAVQGFELFNISQNSEFKLVFTSFFSDYTKDQLNRISRNLIFTGNVPVSELNWLYKNADAVLFPSEYEGLGLPILEAVNLKKKIACSKIPVFREISKSAFKYFDPKLPEEIAASLKEVVQPEANSLLSEYPAIEKKYTWDRTASILLDTLAEKEKKPEAQKPRKKIAILCPDPSGYSAIGKVVAESHNELSNIFDIDYYYERGPEHKYLRPDYLRMVADNAFDVSDFNQKAYSQYDAVIYHIGNSEYHLVTIANALRYPGYAIFHDTKLERAFEQLNEFGIIDDVRFSTESEIDKLLKTRKGKFLSTVSNGQLGVVVHSNYAKSAVSEVCKDVPVQKLNLPTSVPALANLKDGARKKVGLAGIIADVKGLKLVEDLVQSDFSSSLDIYIFGYIQSDHLRQKVESMPGVKLIANPSDFEFQTLLSEMDVLLNYRLQYNGETSLTVIEALRHGVATVVRDIGWYSELPGAAVVKVKSEQEAILAVNKLLGDDGLRRTIAQNATQYVAENHSHANYAKGLSDLLESKESNAGLNKDIAEMIKSSSSKTALISKLRSV